MKDANGTQLSIGDEVWTTVVGRFAGGSHLQKLKIKGFGKKMVILEHGHKTTRYPQACIRVTASETCENCKASRPEPSGWTCHQCDWEH